jgi:putative addiction module CopG family antidote
MIKPKVASGEYASESEVVRDGLRTLQARDAALEKWLHDEVSKKLRRARSGREQRHPSYRDDGPTTGNISGAGG